MSKPYWIALLVAYELTWVAYLARLVPLSVAMLTRASEVEIRHLLVRLITIMPVVLLITTVSWAAAIYDVSRRQTVDEGLLWGIGFIALGMIVLPIYYAVHVRPAISG